MADCGFTDTPNGSGSSLLTYIGPTLKVNIGFDENFDPNKKPIVIPTAAINDVEALVDTGASMCCIDNLIAAQIGLPIVDRQPIAGAHGSQMVNMYLAQIFIPSLNFVMNGRFAGVDLVAGGQSHKALIGRTLLREFTMLYEGKTGR